MLLKKKKEKIKFLKGLRYSGKPLNKQEVSSLYKLATEKNDNNIMLEEI